MTFEEFESDRWADDGGPVTDWHFAHGLLNKEMAQGLVLAAFAEYQKMNDLWQQVIEHCGAKLPNISAVPVPPWEMDMSNMGAGLGMDREGNEIMRRLGYGMGITTVFDDDELRAMMAHELAHFVNGDLDSQTNTKAQEEAADAYAAKYGYAVDLARALQTVLAETGMTDDQSDDDNIHPLTSTRVRTLNAMAQAA